MQTPIYKKSKITGMLAAASLLPLSLFGADGIYVAQNAGGVVKIIDTTTQQFVPGTLTAPSTVQSFAFDGITGMYMAAASTSKVVVFDVTTEQQVASITVGPQPSDLALNGGTGMYVANALANNINIIDITTLQVAGTISATSSLNRPISLALAGTTMWVANNFGSMVTRIDVTIPQVAGTVRVGTAPAAIAFDGRTGIYVANSAGNNVNVIDIDTVQVCGTIPAGTSPNALAFDGRTGMYVSNIGSGSNTVNIIDIDSLQIAGTVSVSGPRALALDGGTGMYVAGNAVKIIDIDTLQVVGSLTATTPQALGLAPYSAIPPPPPPPSSGISTTGLSGNAKKTADYINTLGDSSLSEWFSGLSFEETVDALNATCGSRNHAPFLSAEFVLQTATRSLSTHLRGAQSFFPTHSPSSETSEQHLQHPHFFNTTAHFSDNQLIASSKPMRSCSSQNARPSMSVWVLNTAEYAHLKQSPDNNPALGFFSDTTLLGLDYQNTERQLIGGLLGYAHIHNHDQNNSGHARSNLYMGSVYGDLFWDHFYLSPGLIVAFDATEQMRKIEFTGFKAKASSNLFSWLLDGHVELGYEIMTKGAVWAPFSLLDWTFAWTRGYKEHGASPFNENSPAQTGSLLRSETGVRSFQHFCYSWGDIVLIEKASYVLEKPFSAGDIQTGFVGTPGYFSIVYANHLLNLGALGFDLSFYFGKQNPTELKVGFEGEAGSRYWSSQATLELSQKF